MSSRALRKAQKQREKLEPGKQQMDAEKANSEDEEDEEDIIGGSPPKRSAFEMLIHLQDDGLDEADESGGRDKTDGEGAAQGEAQDTDVDDNSNEVTQNSPTKQQASASKKKKKKKKKAAKSVPQHARPEPSDADEIDAALKAASLQEDSRGLSVTQVGSSTHDEELEVCAQLSIDTHHLHVSNEMRRLFGRAAFDAELEERTQNQANQRQTPQGESVGLADALSGRLSNGGAGLPAMLRRRNIFIQGREDWPRQTGNGLTMEIEAKAPNGITTYSFVHTKPYRTTQSIFTQFVALMDPTNMVNLARYNPYHVSTLLQVSEIAKQERDNATSGMLLERALFAFGKALHPSFAANLAKGKARLDFRRPENREFFLAAWKYIGNIGMRATWRTAYEWMKVLLSLDPSGDHYCVHLVIDKLAIRAKQAKSFIDLASTRFFSTRWAGLANIRYSLTLAQKMVDGDTSSESEKLLRQAVQQYPWVAARLYQSLGVDKIPPGVWGALPPTDKDKLHSELYVTLSQDIWKLPDNTNFLKKTINDAPKDSFSASHESTVTTEITVDEARFVILNDKPELIALLPRSLTSRVDSMADPLRPEDSIDSYALNDSASPAATEDPGATGHPSAEVVRAQEWSRSHATDPARATEILYRSRHAFIDEIIDLISHFTSRIPGWYSPIQGGGPRRFSFVEFNRMYASVEADTGLNEFEIDARIASVDAFRSVVAGQAEGRVSSEDGTATVVMEADGMMRVTVTDGEETTESLVNWWILDETGEEADEGEGQN